MNGFLTGLHPHHLHRLRHLHFLGMGGSGMLGLAEWALIENMKVTGSDRNPSPALDRLVRLGAKMTEEEGISSADLVVRSAAIGPQNPQLRHALREKIPVITRGQFLAEMSRHRQSISVCGSHGKTTTTALIGQGLRRVWPSHVYLGAVAKDFGSSFHAGDPTRLVAEVDESDGSFLDFQTDLTVLTGLSNDHEQHYGSKEKLFDAFAAYLKKTSVLSKPIVCMADPAVEKFVLERNIEVLSYGNRPEFDVSFANFSSMKSISCFDVKIKTNGAPIVLHQVRLPLLGEHNVLNALAAIAVACELGVDLNSVVSQLASFGGVARRMEQLVSTDRVDLYSDYAHNPQKIGAALAALGQSYGAENVVCFFEPHRYSRLQTMWSEFIDVFRGVKKLFVLPIYSAGEAPIEGLDESRIVSTVGVSSRFAHPTHSHFSDILQGLKKETTIQAPVAVVFVGAGQSHEYAMLFAQVLLKDCHEKQKTSQTIPCATPLTGSNSQ